MKSVGALSQNLTIVTEQRTENFTNNKTTKYDCSVQQFSVTHIQDLHLGCVKMREHAKIGVVAVCY